MAQIPDRRTVEHSSLTASQRSQRARLAASRRWAKQDRTEGTAPARAGFMERFAREVDPDGELDPMERARRAETAMRAHMQSLAFRRSRAS